MDYEEIEKVIADFRKRGPPAAMKTPGAIPHFEYVVNSLTINRQVTRDALKQERTRFADKKGNAAFYLNRFFSWSFIIIGLRVGGGRYIHSCMLISRIRSIVRPA